MRDAEENNFSCNATQTKAGNKDRQVEKRGNFYGIGLFRVVQLNVTLEMIGIIC